MNKYLGFCIKFILSLVIIYFIFIFIISIIILYKKNSFDNDDDDENDGFENIFPLPDDIEDVNWDTFLYPTRLFPSFSPDPNFFNESVDICEDLYGYSCGNFNMGPQNEALHIVHNETAMKKFFIEIAVTHDPGFCVLPGSGCKNANKYYKACTQDKSFRVDRVGGVINKMYSGIMDIDQGHIKRQTYKKIRFLIENGITNFVHWTKERTNPQIKLGVIEYTWVHYLRPGGVLFPDKTLHLDLYGENGLGSYEKEVLTLGDWLEEMPNTRDMFGVNAEPGDTLYVENREYFENLDSLLQDIEPDEINNRLKWFARNSLKFFDAQSCLDQAKLLFPITMCRSYLRLSGLDEEENIGVKEEECVHSQFVDNDLDNDDFIEGVTPKLNTIIGGCSSLLHSKNIADDLVKVENQDMTDFDFETIHEQMFKRWYPYYDPVYLYFTYPRILEFVQDPLDWYTQTNAFYDSFHDEVVIPPGIMQYPIFDHNYKDDVGKYSRFGYIVGHEKAHHLLSTTVLPNHPKFDFEIELVADIIGLSKAFSCAPRCKFFIMYAQMFCSSNPMKKYDVSHSCAYDRVNIPVDFGSSEMIDKFNSCFGCNKKIY